MNQGVEPHGEEHRGTLVAHSLLTRARAHPLMQA